MQSSARVNPYRHGEGQGKAAAVRMDEADKYPRAVRLMILVAGAGVTWLIVWIAARSLLALVRG